MFSTARSIVVILSVVHLSEVCLSANILFYGAIGTHSIRISLWPLMDALSDKHNITYLSALKNFELGSGKKSKINMYEPKVWADSFGGSWDKHISFYEIRKKQRLNRVDEWYEYMKIGIEACELLYSDPDFVEWVKNAKFDMVVMECVFNECAYGLINYWNVKFATYCTASGMPWFPEGQGLPDETSSIASEITGWTSGAEMTLYERTVNALAPVAMHILRQYWYYPALEKVTREGLAGEGKELAPFREVEKNMTILLLTQHYSINAPQAFTPNIIPVGGNVVSGKVKPLSEDVEAFINSGDNGFIFVSFGTVVDFSNFDEVVQAEFIKALGQFPEMRFVWKSNVPITAAPIPKNVLLAKWLPQQTLLNHPKIKAFITHAGMGSTTEAIHFSVPVVCLPVLADQDGNADGLEKRDAGIKLEIVGLKQAELEGAIREILHNKKYREGMNRLTKIFKDRPIPTLENAVWWMEYVLRHDNVHEFLAHPSIHQPWWKRRQIDVWLTAVLLLLTVVGVLSYILYALASKLLSSHKMSKKIKKS